MKNFNPSAEPRLCRPPANTLRDFQREDLESLTGQLDRRDMLALASISRRAVGVAESEGEAAAVAMIIEIQELLGAR